MNALQIQTKLIVVFGLAWALWGLGGCEESLDNNYNNNVPPPSTQDSDSGNADADADTDTDADADTDTDADADTDTDADIPPDGDPCAACAGFDGVDILVVVDNSGSMIEEQQIMATGFYTLINSLVTPTADAEYSDGADNVRVAVISTDMGFQYGGGGATVEHPKYCDNAMGDDGQFRTVSTGVIAVQSNEIKCDPDGHQCPTSEWTCVNGYCVAPGAGNAVQCPPITMNMPWTEVTTAVPNAALATQVSCLAQLGTDGCGFEQQLQAGIRALERPDQNAFLQGSHLLAVIVVSDEEDCSIKFAELFQTPEWIQGLNTACNYPQSNEDNFLFDADYFYSKLIGLKGNRANAVVFAAIVGVPMGDNSPCQGAGDTIDGCLGDPSMTYNPVTFTRPEDDVEYVHFQPACVRTNEAGVELTQARPGRRYVKVAQKFGCTGFVYSICNADWSEPMSEIARRIAKCMVI